jgi:hypothetical protein
MRGNAKIKSWENSTAKSQWRDDAQKMFYSQRFSFIMDDGSRSLSLTSLLSPPLLTPDNKQGAIYSSNEHKLHDKRQERSVSFSYSSPLTEEQAKRPA